MNNLEELVKISKFIEKFKIKNLEVDYANRIWLKDSFYYRVFIECEDYPVTQLPVTFIHANGSFDVANIGLTTLKGCPRYIGKIFDMAFNKINYFDEKIDFAYSCNLENNPLKSLKGCPSISYKGILNCSEIEIENLEGIPNEIQNLFIEKCNQLISLKGVENSKIKRLCLMNNQNITNLDYFPEVEEFVCTGNFNLQDVRGCKNKVKGKFLVNTLIDSGKHDKFTINESISFTNYEDFEKYLKESEYFHNIN